MSTSDTTAATAATSSTAGSRRQKRMGPAPIASFEDLSDEVRARLESPDENSVTGSVVRLPGIREDVTPGTPACRSGLQTPEPAYTGISLVGAVRAASPQQSAPSSRPPSQTGSRKCKLQAPNTPRIDISRASSSSHHDSKDSSPDKEDHEVRDPVTEKLGVGFREDGTLDLRSSTEELYFQDPEKRKQRSRPQSPSAPADDAYHNYQRKDSQCSEIGLLCISGRTSRLSSIGSQSSAQSRLSNASHLSILSGQSDVSRSPSPHKMLLETSFCGTRSPQSISSATLENPGTKVESDVLEKVLLSRKHDPREAILAEGISVQRSESQRVRQPPEKPARKLEKRVQSLRTDITIKVDKPPNNDNITPRPTKRVIAPSGVEYIYIPLKGPLPLDFNEASSITIEKPIRRSNLQSRSRHTHPKQSQASTSSTTGSTTTPVQKSDKEPKYIRIKLKPDYLYPDSDKQSNKPNPSNIDLEEIKRDDSAECPSSEVTGRISTATPAVSPKLPKQGIVKDIGNRTPSPSLSRKSSFCSLFRSKETITSPESPTVPSHRRKNTITGILREASESLKERGRSRSKSRETDKDRLSTSNAPSSTESIDSKSKQKSIFSIFKSKGDKKSDAGTSSSETLPNLETISKVEFRFNENQGKFSKPAPKEKALESDSIRIPLHSPTHYEHESLLLELKTPSQDSQDTVIEVKKPEVSKDNSIQSNEEIALDTSQSIQNRQSSTSSENIVFTTKIGTNNETFTTKLPKDKFGRKFTTKCDIEVISNGRLPNNSSAIDPIRTELEVKKEKPQEQTTKSNVNIRLLPMGDKTKHENKNETKIEKPLNESKTNITVAQKKVLNADQEERKDNQCLEKNEIINTKPIVVEIKPEKYQPPSPSQTCSNNKPEATIEKKLTNTPNKEPKDEQPSSQIKPSTSMQKMVELNHNTLKNVDKRTKKSPTASHKKPKSFNSDSSESDKDSEVSSTAQKKDMELTFNDDALEPERKGLVLTDYQDSFEEELPYVPTTLPLERSAALPIIPIKQRSTYEIKTYPIERPRSTTPIHPSSLEDYCEEISTVNENISKAVEKLIISLPNMDSTEKTAKSPRKAPNTNWFDFGDKNPSGTNRKTPGDSEEPPPLPPKGIHKEWINFEDVPEKRKLPKRIQTIPSRSHIEVPDSVIHDNVVYNYVNPDECKCECHELKAKEKLKQELADPVRDDELPLLDIDPPDEEKINSNSTDKIKTDLGVADRQSLISDSSVDLSAEQQEVSASDGLLQTPFTTDLGISSNRSSIASQDDSPDSPNAFPKTS